MLIAIVEMPKNSRMKYEISKTTGKLILDRPVKAEIPHNYGFIPNTLCQDGDPIDVFIAALEPIPPLTEVKIEIIGVIDCIDGDKHDPKLLAYIVGDDLARLLINPSEFTHQCVQYLREYKTGLHIEAINVSVESAEKILLDSERLFENHKHPFWYGTT